MYDLYDGLINKKIYLIPRLIKSYSLRNLHRKCKALKVWATLGKHYSYANGALSFQN